MLDFYKIPAVNDLFYSISVGNFKFTDMDNFVRVGDNIELKDESKTTDQNMELAIKNKLVSNASLFVLVMALKRSTIILPDAVSPFREMMFSDMSIRIRR